MKLQEASGASQHPEMHSQGLSQTILLRVGRRIYLACHTKIQITNFYCLWKSLHSSSWGWSPGYKHTFSGDLSLFISHSSVKENADFCHPGKNSVRFYVALSITLEGLGKPDMLAVGHRATAESKSCCHRQVPHTDICSTSCVARLGPLSSLSDMGADPK